MRTQFFIFYFLIASTLCHAQSTGYMGKRLLLGYGFHTSPAFFGANKNNETIIGTSGSAETGSLAFNAIHEGYLEFAASSKWMICFSTRYYKTVYDNAMRFNDYNYSSSYSYNDNQPRGYYNIRGLTYSLYFKYYGSRYVAPWGRYVMFGPVINTTKATYDPAIMNIRGTTYHYGYSDTLFANFGPKSQNFSGVNLMLGFGRSRIIANRVTIDYGCNLQLFSVLSGFFDVISSDSDVFIDRKIGTTNYIESTVKRRVRGINRFNLFGFNSSKLCFDFFVLLLCEQIYS